MARTRSQIKTVVDSYTGRATEKATIIETLCDEALRVALNHQPFFDASAESTIVITEDAVSLDLSATISDMHNLVNARIIETSGDKNSYLKLRGRFFWDSKVLNPEDNQKGWPVNGLYDKPYLYFDRPAESGISLKARATTYQTFTNDSTECPIELLDIFVTQYVTAYLFLSIEQQDQYMYWRNICLGKQFEEGIIGGSLLHAINIDKKTWMHFFKADRDNVYSGDQIAVQNLITVHDDYGNVRLWSSSL